MTFDELKEKIYNDGQIENILQLLGCKHIKREQGGSLITACLPNGDNMRSIQVKNNPSLPSVIRTRNITGSLLDVISYINNTTFITACEWVKQELGYNTFIKDKEKAQHLKWLKRIQRDRTNNVFDEEENTLPILDKNILNQYIPFVYDKFAKEHINHLIQEEFGVAYDQVSNRIIIPIHDLQGNLVGVKARSIVEDKRKYLYLYPTRQEFLLFNYHRAYEHITEKNEVIIGESEKFTMQLWGYGYKNAVGLGHLDPTKRQIQILKELRVNIVLAYDKGININYIKDKWQHLGIFRNIYIIYDENNILQDKESPTDKGKEIWELMYKNKKKLF